MLKNCPLAKFYFLKIENLPPEKNEQVTGLLKKDNILTLKILVQPVYR